MKKKNIIAKGLLLPLLSVLWLAASPLRAQEAAPDEALNEIFAQLLHDKNAQTDSVRYTGCDFKKVGGGFVWGRGRGKGWTAGQRIRLSDVSPREAQKIREKFEEIAKKQFVNKKENSAATFFDALLTFYIYEYVPDSSKLYFMKATTESASEVCVPVIWKTANYVDATLPDLPPARNPLEGADEQQLRLLGLARLWAGAERNFVFMDKVKLSWDSAYAAAIPQIIQAKDRNECGRIMQRMAALLGDGHTYVAYSDTTLVYPLLTTRWVDGHVYLEEVSSQILSAKGLKRGMEIVSIDGEPVLEYGRTHLQPYVSSSTPQWTLHEMFDGKSLLTVPRGTQMALVLKDGDKTVSVDYTAERETADTESKEPLAFSKLSHGVGYLRINRFWGESFSVTFDKIYKQILETDALIIDVRGNSGGNSGLSQYVLSHLTTDSIVDSQWSSPTYVPAYASWGMPSEPVVQRGRKYAPLEGKTIYDKPVVVLVDRGTFSAAEDFTVMFRGMKRGVIIGEPTGGSTGNGVRFELIPGHSYANICAKHDVAPDGTEFVGVGIQPDVVVKETYQSWFKDKNDAAMSAALEYLRENR